MKKTIIYLFMAFSLLACNKEQPAEPVSEEKLTLDFSVSGGLEPETKGVKTNWANNDRDFFFEEVQFFNIFLHLFRIGD